MKESCNNKINNEYIDVIVKHNLGHLCSDCFHALGWTIISTSTGLDSIKLKLERNKKITNRAALCELQRECEAAFIELEKLDITQNTKIKGITRMISMIGIIFLVCSILSYTRYSALLSLILALLGLIGLGTAYYIYKKLIVENAKKIKMKMSSYYDVIYNACEKANHLLNENLQH